METQEKQYSFLNILAAFMVTGFIYLASFVGPVANAVRTEFAQQLGQDPDAFAVTYKTINMIPSLMMVFLSLLSGILTSKFPIKKIVLFAAAFSITGTLIPAFTHTWGAYVASRVVFGVGNGLLFPMASAVINQLFTGSLKDRLMGLRAGVGALMGACFTTLGGIIGRTDWRHAFMCAFVGIPLWLLILWKCPTNEVYSKAKAEAGVSEKKFTGRTFAILAAVFVFNMMMMAFQANLPLVMASEKIAESSVIGTVQSTITVCAFLAGLVFAAIKKASGRFVTPLAFLLVGLGTLVICYAKSLPLFYIAAVIFGFGFGFYNPAVTLAVAQSAASPKYGALAISLYTSVLGVAQFISAMTLSTIAKIFNLNMGLRNDWQVSWPTVLIVVAAAVVYIASTGGKEFKKKGETK